MLVASPLALALALLFLAGAGVDAGVLPARGGERRRRAGERRSRRRRRLRISAPSSSGSWRSAARCRSSIPAEGAKVLIVKFNDYQCPACGQSYLALQADPREVRRVASRRGASWS